MNLNKLEKISDIELILEFKNRKSMALEIKRLRGQIDKTNRLIDYIENASSSANKGTVLEMVYRKILKFKRVNPSPQETREGEDG